MVKGGDAAASMTRLVLMLGCKSKLGIAKLASRWSAIASCESTALAASP